MTCFSIIDQFHFCWVFQIINLALSSIFFNNKWSFILIIPDIYIINAKSCYKVFKTFIIFNQLFVQEYIYFAMLIYLKLIFNVLTLSLNLHFQLKFTPFFAIFNNFHELIVKAAYEYHLNYNFTQIVLINHSKINSNFVTYYYFVLIFKSLFNN